MAQLVNRAGEHEEVEAVVLVDTSQLVTSPLTTEGHIVAPGELHGQTADFTNAGQGDAGSSRVVGEYFHGCISDDTG
ncbi:hypothetical protein D3C74_414750 [compost metagenome]